MINFLKGLLVSAGNGAAVVDVGGVGFDVFISENSLRALPALGESVGLLTYLHLREDGASLFGFVYEEERRAFRALISVSGVGPKSALGILSIATPRDLAVAVGNGNPELLRVSGVGRKTAERLVVELKGKLATSASSIEAAALEEDADVESALMHLGYGKHEIKEVIRQLDKNITGVESKIRAALKLIKK